MQGQVFKKGLSEETLGKVKSERQVEGSQLFKLWQYNYEDHHI